jgi:hypothetical protein
MKTLFIQSLIDETVSPQKQISDLREALTLLLEKAEESVATKSSPFNAKRITPRSEN